MRLMIALALVAIVGLCFVAPGFVQAAADGHAAEAKSGEADKKGDHGHKEEPFEKRVGLTRWDLGIYTLVVFGLLVIILGKFAWGPMISGLDKREATLKSIHDDAATARDEAKKALSEVQARLAKANDEVRAMLEEARRDAQVVKDQLKAEASAEIQAERDRNRRDIEVARDAALQEIYQQAVQLAAMISTKAVHRELSPADHSRLLDESLADLKSNLGTRA